LMGDTSSNDHPKMVVYATQPSLVLPGGV